MCDPMSASLKEPQFKRLQLTLSWHSNCFSQALELNTRPDSFVATGEGCEYGQGGFEHSVACLQICSCSGFVGRGTAFGALGWGGFCCCGAGRPPPLAKAGLNTGALGLKPA